MRLILPSGEILELPDDATGVFAVRCEHCDKWQTIRVTREPPCKTD